MTGDPIEDLLGSFHQVSESKIAPMLVTGSYVGWMIDIMGKYIGQTAEYQLANDFRTRKRIQLQEYFTGVAADESKLNIIE